MTRNYEELNAIRMMTGAKKRVAAYCRVSTDREDQANSFESQQRYFKAYIEREPNWELVEVFADEGKTGTNTKKRRAFNRMIEAAKRGELDLIVTKEISRFARNTLDSVGYTRELKKLGVGVIFLNDNINTLDPDAELRLTIMSSIAQEESRKTSERVKWGQKRRMEQGVVFGRSLLGYDVKNGKMTVNEEGAKVVRRIFDKFVNENKGCFVIARELKEEGVDTMRCKEWSNTVILRILRNEKYCGDLVQKKTYTPDYLSHDKKYNRGQEEFVILHDHHEPIVSRETFEAAAKILDSRALSPEGKAKHSNRFCFSGKIKCGKCGRSFVAKTRRRRDGSRYKCWRCYESARRGSFHTDASGNEVGCTQDSIRNEDALHIMYLVAQSLEMDKELVLHNLKTAIEQVISADFGCIDTAALEQKIIDVEAQKTRLIELYMGSSISLSEFMAMREKCDKEIADYKRMIESVIQQGKAMNRKDEMLREIASAVDEIALELSYDDEFYRGLLDRMVVHDRNHIDVYLNFLPHKWSYALFSAAENCATDETSVPSTGPLASAKNDAPEAAIFGTPVPISVSVARTRSSGIE
ncbi:MAG: recombinase family protein [Clostridia bacterium]|nr:recombinase family protein [Clostridia bacterium]